MLFLRRKKKKQHKIHRSEKIIIFFLLLGLSLMKEKYLLSKFGVCPRVLCERQTVLPIGMSEELRTSRVKVKKEIFLSC